MSSRLVALAALVCGLLAAGPSHRACAASYSPDSPEVKKAVAAAVAYLEAAPPDERPGAMALVGRVMLFQGKPDHPLVGQAVAAVRKMVKEPDINDPSLIYSVGISLVFLAELDAEAYRGELRSLAALLVQRQKPHGGWGYANRPTGDTSMTQYALYGLWSAGRYGVSVDDDVWKNATHWLTAVQDIGGAWPYQGEIPEGSRRISQKDLRRSMTEAALATLYLSGNHFNVFDFRPAKGKTVSSLLRPVNAPAPTAPRIDPRDMQSALSSGAGWLQSTADGINDYYPLYHLYTIERYQSFRTAALRVPEPTAWYDAGVTYLLEKQIGNGAWDGHEGSAAGTAFGVLFLIRSTKAALSKEALGPGTLYGGRGVPTAARPQAADAAPGVARPQDQIDGLLQSLDDPNFLRSLSGLTDLQPIKDQPAPNALTKRLGEIARGESPEAKAAALRGLGRSRDLASAPILIEAILDPNPLVHQAAVDGLREMSRDSNNYGKPLATDSVARTVEAKRWWDWYRKIRPVGP